MVFPALRQNFIMQMFYHENVYHAVVYHAIIYYAKIYHAKNDYAVILHVIIVQSLFQSEEILVIFLRQQVSSHFSRSHMYAVEFECN